MTADDVIQLLKLQPHPVEGGYFRETYRSAEMIPGGVLQGFNSVRSLGTAIYYLLRPGTFSAMHRLPGDEIFHFYLGNPVRMLLLHPNGSSEEVILGNDLAAGHQPQVIVPGGVWQGSSLEPGGAYALLGTTMSPGFAYQDYEHGDRATLAQAYPGRQKRINELTRV